MQDHDTAPPGPPLPHRAFVMQAFDQYERKLTAYALKFYGGASGDLDAARDAVQFTFLQLCRQSVGDVQDKLAPWLYTVCRNRIFDDRAKRKSRQAAMQAVGRRDDSPPNPDRPSQEIQWLQKIPEIVSTLIDSQRAVVELWSQGLKPKEIAQVLDRPPGTVRVQLHRGIKSLQQHPEVQNWLERATSQPVHSVEQTS